jgi:hypothetical protein
VSEGGALPELAEAQTWVGSELDDVGGSHLGRVEGVYADADGGIPAWLVVALPRGGARRFSLRRRSAKRVALQVRDCAAMPNRVWTAQGGEAVRAAPAVDPTRPLLREHEATICTHYGVGERVGRHAEVAGRPAGSITARPA